MINIMIVDMPTFKAEGMARVSRSGSAAAPPGPPMGSWELRAGWGHGVLGFKHRKWWSLMEYPWGSNGLYLQNDRRVIDH